MHASGRGAPLPSAKYTRCIFVALNDSSNSLAINLHGSSHAGFQGHIFAGFSPQSAATWINKSNGLFIRGFCRLIPHLK